MMLDPEEEGRGMCRSKSRGCEIVSVVKPRFFSMTVLGQGQIMEIEKKIMEIEKRTAAAGQSELGEALDRDGGD